MVTLKKNHRNIILSVILLAGISFSVVSIIMAATPDPGHDYTAVSGGVVQGNLLYGSAADTLSALAKDANATRYLSNQGTSNNPSWNQVNLANGVTGVLPVGNIAAFSGLGDCDNATTSKLLWNISDGSFSCGTDQSAAATGWTDDGAIVRLTTVGDSVGIGVAAAQSKLDVRGAYTVPDGSMTRPILNIVSTDAATNGVGGTLQFSGQIDTGTYNGMAAIQGGPEAVGFYPSFLSISVNDSGNTFPERLRIISSGNVGIGTTTPDQKLDVEGFIVTTGSQTMAAADKGIIEITNSINNSAARVAALQALPTFTGAGTNPKGLNISATYIPSANIATANAARLAGVYAPPTGVSITTALGMSVAMSYDATAAGAVTTGAAIQINAPSAAGTLKPVTQYGLNILNQGLSGITNSYGLYVVAQGGSTNNYSAIFEGGNVGIGTAIPQSLLHVSGSNAGGQQSQLMLENRGATVNTEASLGFNTDTSFFETGRISSLRIDSPNSGDTALLFYTTGLSSLTEKLRITGSGNVGIGTILPTATLAVAGTASVSGGYFGSGLTTCTGGSFLQYTVGTGLFSCAAGTVSGWTDDGTVVRLTDITNSVGIGTVTPDTTLELSGATAPKFSMSDTGLTHAITSFASTSVFFQVEQVTNDDGGARVWGFSDSVGLTPLRIIGAFGNTDPTDSIAGIWFLAGKRSGAGVADLGALETAFQFTNGGSSTHFMTILGSGNIGIGTTAPSQQLEVAGSIEIPTTTSSTTGVIYKGANRFIHDFALAGTNGVNTFVGINAGNFTMTGSINGQGSYNTAVGHSALTSLTTGFENTATGYAALLSNTSGNKNTALGFFALADNTSGLENTATGYAALANNTSGTYNTATGTNALDANTTGIGNTAVGTQASYLTVDGQYNTTLGYRALYSNTVGYNNVAIGATALYDYNYTNGGSGLNTVVGTNSGRGITTGTLNTIIGANVTGLAANLTSTIILADGVGNKRLYIDSAGEVGIGTEAPGELLSIAGTRPGISINQTSGSPPSRFMKALTGSTLGISTNADFDGTNWNRDDTSLYSTVYSALSGAQGFYYAAPAANPISFLTGLYIAETGNVGVGTNAPGSKLEVRGGDFEITRVSGDTTTMALQLNNDSAATGGNWWFLVRNSTGNLVVFNLDTGADVMTFNGGNVGLGKVPGTQLDLSTDAARKLTTTTWTTGSDARIKTDIQSIDNALDIIRRVRPVKFRYDAEFLAANPSVVNTTYYNFIAQEYQQIFPNSVTETDGLLYLNPSEMIPYAIAGVKALDAQIAKEVTTKSLCVSDDSGAKTCISKQQLDALISGAGAGSTQFDATPTPTPTPPEIVSTTTSPAADEGSSPTSSPDNIAPSSISLESPLPSSVVDVTAPVITLLGDTITNVSIGGEYTEEGATALDDTDGAIIAVFSGVVDTTATGSYTIHYNATDAAGNDAEEVTRTVLVGGSPLGFPETGLVSTVKRNPWYLFGLTVITMLVLAMLSLLLRKQKGKPKHRADN